MFCYFKCENKIQLADNLALEIDIKGLIITIRDLFVVALLISVTDWLCEWSSPTPRDGTLR